MIVQPSEGDAAAVSAVGLRHKYRITNPRAPLVLLVHGRAGNFDVMWAFRRTIPDSFSILAPQAPIADPIGGYSWWLLNSEGKREEGKAEASAGLLRSGLDRALSHYALTPPFILGAGFSQGAALLSVLVQRPDNPFEGAALLAGFVLPQSEPVRGGTKRILMANGTEDDVIRIETARKGAESLRGIGYEVEQVEDPVAHKIGSNGMRALTAWMSSFGPGEG